MEKKQAQTIRLVTIEPCMIDTAFNDKTESSWNVYVRSLRKQTTRGPEEGTCCLHSTWEKGVPLMHSRTYSQPDDSTRTSWQRPLVYEVLLSFFIKNNCFFFFSIIKLWTERNPPILVKKVPGNLWGQSKTYFGSNKNKSILVMLRHLNTHTHMVQYIS